MVVRASPPARFILAALLSACDAPPAPQPAPPARPPPPSPVPPADVHAPTPPSSPASPASWISLQAVADRNLADQLALEIKTARVRELVPIVYIAAAWCGPCIAIRKLRRDPRLVDAIQGVHMIELDVDEWRWADLTAQGFTPHEVPTFNKVDAAGKALGEPLRSDGWGSDVPALLPPRLAAFIASSP